jgi:DNA-binding HxlR family transcriptional regulator
LLGDWWTPLVLRELFAGKKRFDEIAESLGIPRPVLTQRLNRLVEEGILIKTPYQERPVRHEYRFTPKGRDLFGVLAALWRWGSDWAFDGDEAPVFIEPGSGRVVKPLVVDEETGVAIDARKLRVRYPKPLGAATGAQGGNTTITPPARGR